MSVRRANRDALASLAAIWLDELRQLGLFRPEAFFEDGSSLWRDEFVGLYVREGEETVVLMFDDERDAIEWCRDRREHHGNINLDEIEQEGD